MKVLRVFFLMGSVCLLNLILSGCGTMARIPPVLKTLDKNVGQALIVEMSSSCRFKARLKFWQRQNNDWQRILTSADVVIGRNGLASVGKKREGDGRTPTGIFRLGTAFGYLPAIQTKLAYRQTTKNDFWVDDPSSSQYNQWVQGTPQAKSFERMHRDDDLYKYGIVIEYNTNPIVEGKGSAIFMHVWRGPDSSTAGCVAMRERKLLQLLRRLDQSRNPSIVFLSPPETFWESNE